MTAWALRMTAWALGMTAWALGMTACRSGRRLVVQDAEVLSSAGVTPALQTLRPSRHSTQFKRARERVVRAVVLFALHSLGFVAHVVRPALQGVRLVLRTVSRSMVGVGRSPRREQSARRSFRFARQIEQPTPRLEQSVLWIEGPVARSLGCSIGSARP
jgi:hypothetical protein